MTLKALSDLILGGRVVVTTLTAVLALECNMAFACRAGPVGVLRFERLIEREHIKGVFATLENVIFDPEDARDGYHPGRFFVLNVRSTVFSNEFDRKKIVVRGRAQIPDGGSCDMGYPKYEIGKEYFFPFKTNSQGIFELAFGRY